MTAERRQVPVMCVCSWRGQLETNGACPSCRRSCYDRITAKRLEVLRVIGTGVTPSMMPQLRIRLVELGLIVANGPKRPTTDGRKNPPPRPYRLTEMGRRVVAVADGEAQAVAAEAAL